MRVDVEDILRKNDEVGKLTDFQRAFCFFTAPGKRRSERVAVNRLRHGEPLLGGEACFWLTFQRFARGRRFNSLPRIESHGRPIAAEGQAGSCSKAGLSSPTRGM